MKTRTTATAIATATRDYLNEVKSEGGVRKKRARIHYTSEQIQAFEKLFYKNNFPDRETLEVICEELDVSHKNAQVWFQNRRARSRRDPNDVSSPRKHLQIDSDSNSPCSSPKPRTRPFPKYDQASDSLLTFVKNPIGQSKWHEPIQSSNTSIPSSVITSPEHPRYQPNVPYPFMFSQDFNSHRPINHDVPFYYQPIKTHETSVPLNESHCPISDILSETYNVTESSYYNDSFNGHTCYGSSGELSYYGNTEYVTSQVRVIADANQTLTVL